MTSPCHFISYALLLLICFLALTFSIILSATELDRLHIKVGQFEAVLKFKCTPLPFVIFANSNAGLSQVRSKTKICSPDARLLTSPKTSVHR